MAGRLLGQGDQALILSRVDLEEGKRRPAKPVGPVAEGKILGKISGGILPLAASRFLLGEDDFIGQGSQGGAEAGKFFALRLSSGMEDKKHPVVGRGMDQFNLADLFPERVRTYPGRPGWPGPG